MREITLTTKQLIEAMDYYSGFTRDVFEYMNARVSPLLSCNLAINAYGASNYGSFKKPNLVEINLGSIVNNFYGASEDYIKFFICLSITHELFHANQSCSMMRYGADREYAELMEAQAEIMSRTFLTYEASALYHMFGFTIPSDILDNVPKPHTFYETIDENVAEWYINVLADSWFKNAAIASTLRTYICNPSPEYRTMFIKFDELTPICIRVNGNYIDESMQLVADAIYDNYRDVRAVYHFENSVGVDIINTEIGLVAILVCKTTSKPVLYPIVDAD